MVTSNNNRDVRLKLGVDVDGGDRVQALGADFRDLGKAGTAAAAELQALAAATAAQRASENSARADALAARKELDDKRTALERLRTSSDQAARSTEAYATAERAARAAVVEARVALRDKQTASAAAAEAARVAAQAEQAHAAALRNTATAAAASARVQADSVGSVSTAVQGLQGTLNTLRNVALAATGGTLVGSLARDLSETADAAATLRARLQLVTGEGPALQSAFQGVVDVANRSGAGLESVGNLFTKLSEAGKELKLGQRDALALTELITQSIAVSGAGVQAADAAIVQFVQGISSGVLRGEELSSVLEQTPRLARALADGLGVATGELKKLGEAGALTSATVIGALQGQSAALQREFSQLPPTVGRAIQQLGTAWTVYVSEADQATGASAAAARAIQTLAENLNTVGAVLLGAGKAVAAFTALRFAATLLEGAAAARGLAAATATAATAATAHATAATASAAAMGTATASAGRLAGVLGTLKTLTFLGLVTNITDVGTALGEAAAKFVVGDKAARELERTLKAEAERAREAAAANAELAQRAERAADAALGLNRASKELVGAFEGVIQKGGTTSEALEKVSKALKLGDIQGIANAGAALDALAVKGKVTAQQVQDAWAAALKGTDLGVFAAEATAAFDRSEQGARRLRTVLDAIADESLRRAGTSARELASGFNTATLSALNDLDALTRTLGQMGNRSVEAGRLLAGSVDKALEAAKTERAVQAVITRIEELGKAGKLSGDQLTQALDGARKKLDDLKPGVNSLAEALRAFGLQTRTELQGTADKLGAAYRVLANDVTVSLQDKATAFAAYSRAAIAANGGVEASDLKLQRTILQTRLDAAGLGDVLAQAMGRAVTATDAATAAQQRLGAAAQTAAGITDRAAQAREQSFTSTPFQSGSSASSAPNAPAPSVYQTGQAVNKPPGDWEYVIIGWDVAGADARGNRLPGGWKAIRGPVSLAGAADVATQRAQLTSGIDPVTGRRFPGTEEAARAAVANQNAGTVGLSADEANRVAATNARNAAGAALAPATTFDTDTPGTVGQYTAVPILGKYEVNFTANGRTTAAFTDTPDQAQAFIDNLQQAFRTAQGG